MQESISQSKFLFWDHGIWISFCGPWCSQHLLVVCLKFQFGPALGSDKRGRAGCCTKGGCLTWNLEQSLVAGGHALSLLRKNTHLWSFRLLRGPDFYQSQKTLKDLPPPQARMQIKVSYLGWGRSGDLSSVGSKLLKCNKLHSKMSACLNSSTPHFPVSSEQAHWKKKSMFPSSSECIKSTGMQGWGKLSGSCCQLCCACLNEDQDLLEVKSSAAPCPVGRTSLLCMAGNIPLSSIFLHFVAGFVSFSVKAVKPLFMDYSFIPWPIPDCMLPAGVAHSIFTGISSSVWFFYLTTFTI